MIAVRRTLAKLLALATAVIVVLLAMWFAALQAQ